MGVQQGFATHLRRGGGLAVAAALASAGVALASSDAVKGASYIGRYAGGATEAISFRVSANGSKVSSFFVETPIKCGGGCGGVPTGSGGSARISRNGKFTIKLKLVALGSTATVIGTDTVTGTFLKHGGAKGTVTSHFTGGPGGRTVSWTATG